MMSDELKKIIKTQFSENFSGKLLVTTADGGKIKSIEQVPDDSFILGKEDMPKSKDDVIAFCEKFLKFSPTRADGKPLTDDDLQQLCNDFNDHYAEQISKKI